MRCFWLSFFLGQVLADRATLYDNQSLSTVGTLHVGIQEHNLVLLSPSPSETRPRETPLALLVAVSGRGVDIDRETEDADFFQALLPSFLETTGSGDGFDYSFYIAFDVGDPFYDSSERRRDFERLFLLRASHRPEDQGSVSDVSGSSVLRRRAKLHWVSVAPYTDGQTGPVRAWNTAFQEAFSDGAAYFYQLGEDVQLVTSGWAEKLVTQLQKQGDVGIAGGRELNYQDDSELMPCVLASRAHMSIFGAFFPTKLHNWWSDDWILRAYQPFHLAAKLSTVEIRNTHATSRYEVSQTDMWIWEQLEGSSHKQISNYLKLIILNKESLGFSSEKKDPQENTASAYRKPKDLATHQRRSHYMASYILAALIMMSCLCWTASKLVMRSPFAQSVDCKPQSC